MRGSSVDAATRRMPDPARWAEKKAPSWLDPERWAIRRSHTRTRGRRGRAEDRDPGSATAANCGFRPQDSRRVSSLSLSPSQLGSTGLHAPRAFTRPDTSHATAEDTMRGEAREQNSSIRPERGKPVEGVRTCHGRTWDQRMFQWSSTAQQNCCKGVKCQIAGTIRGTRGRTLPQATEAERLYSLMAIFSSTNASAKLSCQSVRKVVSTSVLYNERAQASR